MACRTKRALSVPHQLRFGTLRQLDLGGNSLGEGGGRAIGEVLGLNTTLTQLDLYGNSVGDAVGRAIRLSWGARPGSLSL